MPDLAAPDAPVAQPERPDAIPAPPQLEDKPSLQARMRNAAPAAASIPGIESDDGLAGLGLDQTPAPKQKGVAKADGDVAARDASGRFASTVPPPPGADVPEEAAPVPQKYVFEGEEYESEDAFKQSFKSMRGSFKSNLKRATEAEINLGKAAESARAWKAEHDRILAERQSRPPERGSEAPEASKPAEADGVDWELYAEIKRIATDAGEPWKADKWLHEQIDQLTEKKVASRLEQELTPLREREAQEALGAQTENLFGLLAEYVGPDNKPTFPELMNGESAYEVGRTWNSMGLPREYAMTPQGAVAAVALYRMIRAAQESQDAPVEQVTIPSAPRQEQLTAEAANIVGGRPDARPVDPDDHSDSAEARRIKAALRKVPLHQSTYGFAP